MYVLISALAVFLVWYWLIPVIIAILIMSTVNYLSNVNTPKLVVPGSFAPTWEGREWIVTHAFIFADHLLTNPWSVCYSHWARVLPQVTFMSISVWFHNVFKSLKFNFNVTFSYSKWFILWSFLILLYTYFSKLGRYYYFGVYGYTVTRQPIFKM